MRKMEMEGVSFKKQFQLKAIKTIIIKGLHLLKNWTDTFQSK